LELDSGTGEAADVERPLPFSTEFSEKVTLWPALPGFIRADVKALEINLRLIADE
jgi:hypothetical protein